MTSILQHTLVRFATAGAAALLWGGPLPAQVARNVSGGPLRDDQACFDVRHYTLRLVVDIEAKAIAGSVVMRATATADCAKLALDLDPAFQVTSVSCDGVAVPFGHAEGRITFAPRAAPAQGTDFEVEVHYAGVPRIALRPPWDGGFTWGKTKDGAPWIATNCRTEGADLWWPCKDHPADRPDGVDLHVTVPEGLVVAGNGRMQASPTVADGRASFHWKIDTPIPNCGVTMNVGPYLLVEDSFTSIDGTSTPVQLFVLPESERKARRCLPAFLDQVRVFEHLLGPYPFRAQKYGIAETPFEGLDHPTLLAYGNGYCDEQYDAVHCNALAHEWWGNLVTCRDWKDLWLHEAGALYMQALYKEARFGPQAYQREMVRQRTKNLAPIAPREPKTSREILFGPGLVNDLAGKGCWILHSLRYELGDEKFFALLRRFCYPTSQAEKVSDGTQFRFVDTDDFVRMCSDIAGEDLTWFFDVYVRRAELPELRADRDGGMLRLSWATPGDLPFHLSVPVIRGGREERVAMRGGRGDVRVDDMEYRIDPDQRVLARRGAGVR